MPRGSMPGERRGGRQKGTPNRVSATARDNIIRAFDGIGGIPALVEWAKDNRTDFYRLYGRLLPVESHIGGPDGGALPIPPLIIIGSPGEPDPD